jgi:oxygen-independent coproporphyrinogen-3 oxidase
VADATSGADLGVYVHVPFCERVCPYCDFAVEGVGRLEAAREAEYVELLLGELAIVQRELGERLAGRRLATVYLGGGTPSLLTPRAVERLLGGVVDAFAGTPEEVTLELNPGTAEVARIPGFREAGVTRLSVGVQSLHDRTLKRLGRAHRARDALRGLERGLAAGFASLSVDLIVAAPEQRESELLADAERVVALGAAHVSVYDLTIEPGTPFARASARGQLRLPDEETALRMGEQVRARLAAAGLARYEISNHARPGHRSAHNERYWLREDVLGLGPSAASLLGELRFQNLKDTRAWAAGIRAGRRTLAECERLDEEAARRETLFLGLRRLEGVSPAAYRLRFGRSLEADFGAEIAELRGLGLLCDTSGALRLSERGLLFANEVFLRFVGR